MLVTCILKHVTVEFRGANLFLSMYARKTNGIVELQFQSTHLPLVTVVFVQQDRVVFLPIFCLYCMLEVSLWITLAPILLYHCEILKENEC